MPPKRKTPASPAAAAPPRMVAVDDSSDQPPVDHLLGFSLRPPHVHDSVPSRFSFPVVSTAQVQLKQAFFSFLYFKKNKISKIYAE